MIHLFLDGDSQKIERGSKVMTIGSAHIKRFWLGLDDERLRSKEENRSGVIQDLGEPYFGL
jgi:hypothetical protein